MNNIFLQFKIKIYVFVCLGMNFVIDKVLRSNGLRYPLCPSMDLQRRRKKEGFALETRMPHPRVSHHACAWYEAKLYHMAYGVAKKPFFAMTVCFRAICTILLV